MSEQQTSAISVDNLSVELDGHHILENLSFAVPAGQTTAIIGPNGAGKTVLAKTIMNLLPKKTGEIHIFGTNHERYSKVSELLSYVPQKIDLDRAFPLTVEGLFALRSSTPIGIRKKDKEKMEELLRLVGMSKKVHARLTTLSGGQLQRILIAYSLMDDPKLLILDEPAAGIDVSGQDTIYTLLEKIQADRELTMVMISHELDVVMQYADQVLCLNQQLLCAGVPREVLSKDVIDKMYGANTRHYHHHHEEH